MFKGNGTPKPEEEKKTYRITESGRTVLSRALAKEKQLATTMRNLFEEYMKDVLEMDTQPNSPLNIPLPLSDLLFETDEIEEDMIKRLQEQREHTQVMIKQLQKNLRTINKKLDG